MNKRLLIIIGFALVATVAVAGWLRKPATPAYVPATSISTEPYATQPPPPPAYAPQPAPAANSAVYSTEPVYRGGYAAAPPPRAHRQTVEREYVQTAPPQRHGRTLAHSALIVGGSAGAGAAIGALAGGGKGAGIGALAGGAAGLVYDRATHNKTK